MFAKSILSLAALGVVGMWYLRARVPSGMRLRIRRAALAARPAAEDAWRDSPNAAERLTHSHAMGVAGGVEIPSRQEPDAPADAGQAGDAAWPSTREFLRGA